MRAHRAKKSPSRKNWRRAVNPLFGTRGVSPVLVTVNQISMHIRLQTGFDYPRSAFFRRLRSMSQTMIKLAA